MHFCGKCGKQSSILKKTDWNEKYYPYMEECTSCGHKVYTGEHKCEKCSNGMFPFRTKSSSGFQTCHSLDKETAKMLTDKNFHSANIYLGLSGQ